MKPKSHASGRKLKDRFAILAHKTAEIVGSVWATLTAILVIVVWAVTGPLFGFSDTWQLVINTSTTIITFVMVFLIQSTQNRDSKALHLKLDEVIRAVRGARNSFVDLEDMPEEELNALAAEFAALHEKERRAFEKHGRQLSDTSEDGPES